MQKKSTAWWCIGLVQTTFECVQKNPHPRLDFMSGSAEVLNFGLNFRSTVVLKVWFELWFWTELQHSSHYSNHWFMSLHPLSSTASANLILLLLVLLGPLLQDI